MDDQIIDYLRVSPGSSANKILQMYQVNGHQDIVMATIYSRLRKLKKKRAVINKGNRWYINLRN